MNPFAASGSYTQVRNLKKFVLQSVRVEAHFAEWTKAIFMPPLSGLGRASTPFPGGTERGRGATTEGFA